MSEYIITGRSIDGRCYLGKDFIEYAKHKAPRFASFEEAEAVLLQWKEENEKSILDDKIGWLAIKVAPKKRYGYWRKEKRWWRNMESPIAAARDVGEECAYCNRQYRNPYPKGKRHDAFKEGFKLGDLLGQYHGRNI